MDNPAPTYDVSEAYDVPEVSPDADIGPADVGSLAAVPPPISVPGWARHYQWATLGLDAVGGAIAGLLAGFVRFGGEATRGYLVLSLALPLVWITTVAAAQSYSHQDLGSGSDEYRNVIRAGVGLVGVAAFISYVFKLEIARGFVILAVPVACLFSLVVRYVARQVLHVRRSRGECLRSVVVVGRDQAVLTLIRNLVDDPNCGMRVVAACVPDPSAADAIRAEGIDVAGDLASAAAVVRDLRADTVAVTSASETAAVYLRRLSWQLEGTGVELLVAPGLMEVAGPRLHVRPFIGLPLLRVQQPEFTGARRIVKAILDRTVALIGVMILSPLLLLIALCVRFTSPGTALFRQRRVGRDGEPFTVIKFRTMVEDAESQQLSLTIEDEGAGPLFKLRKDPRVTRVGVVLRRFSLDELPQLFNVLGGSMSLVGPRPPLPTEVSTYAEHVNRRLLVKPGLTGLWQISGRSDLTWEESVRLDLRYVENWSLSLDLLILWKTVFAVVRFRGAY